MNILLEIADEIFYIKEGKIVEHIDLVNKKGIERIVIKSNNSRKIYQVLISLGYFCKVISNEECLVEIRLNEYNDLLKILFRLVEYDDIVLTEITKLKRSES